MPAAMPTALLRTPSVPARFSFICAMKGESRGCSAITEMLAFFAELTDDELFYAHEVSLTDFDEFDLPGRPRRKQYCEVCGDLIHDNRAIERDGHTYCRRCAGEHVYYTLGAPISL